MSCHTLPISDDLTLYFVGPPLEKGPLPALFYFSISGKESLTLDPFNQPVMALKDHPLRIFSLDIPGHSFQHNPRDILSLWKKYPTLLGTFFTQVEQATHHLNLDNIGLMGLSRGAFLALHLAARLPITSLVGFAPLIKPHLPDYDLWPLMPALATTPIRLYIGDNDTQVGTANASHFTESLPNAELILRPSIGNQGHGTSQETFIEGALWIAKQLQVSP